MNYGLAAVLSKYYTVIGWTTHGHNGETVPVWVHGADAPVGTIDNTDLALIAADPLGTDLDRITHRLYVDLDEVSGAYAIDKTDPENPVIMVGKAKLPVGKDYMINKKGREIQLPGLTVYAPMTEKVYISKKAAMMLKRR